MANNMVRLRTSNLLGSWSSFPLIDGFQNVKMGGMGLWDWNAGWPAMTESPKKKGQKGRKHPKTKKKCKKSVNLFFHPPFVVDGCGWHHKFQTVFVGLTRICVASKTLDAEMPSKVRFCCWNNFHLRFLLHIKQTRKNNSNKRKTISWDYLDLANKSGQHCFFVLCFSMFFLLLFRFQNKLNVNLNIINAVGK